MIELALKQAEKDPAVMKGLLQYLNWQESQGAESNIVIKRSNAFDSPRQHVGDRKSVVYDGMAIHKSGSKTHRVFNYPKPIEKDKECSIF